MRTVGVVVTNSHTAMASIIALQHYDRNIHNNHVGFFLLCAFKMTLSFLEGFGAWRETFPNIVDQLVGRGFNEALQGFSSPSIFYRLFFFQLLKIGGREY